MKLFKSVQEGWPEGLAGCVMAMRVEALNLLDFFGSFFCQEKNERKVSLLEKANLIGECFWEKRKSLFRGYEYGFYSISNFNRIPVIFNVIKVI